MKSNQNIKAKEKTKFPSDIESSKMVLIVLSAYTFNCEIEAILRTRMNLNYRTEWIER